MSGHIISGDKTLQRRKRERTHTQTVGKEESIHVDVPAVVHPIHFGNGRRRWRRKLLRKHIDALSLYIKSSYEINNTQGQAHLLIYRLQDPTGDSGLTERGTDLEKPDLVTDHPAPRAHVIVHGDVCPNRLIGVVRPEARPAHVYPSQCFQVPVWLV